MKELKPLCITGTILLALALLGSIFLPTHIVSLVTLAFAIFAYFIAPGYMILLPLRLQPHERVIIGAAVSSALLPLLYYTLDIIGIPLSRTTVLGVIVLVCVVSFRFVHHI